MQQRNGSSHAPGHAGPADRAESFAGGTVRRLTSAELLGGAREVVIEHDSELYRLRCTSKGKLILTK